MRNSEQIFPDFVGNENALQQLSQDIAAGRFPHALLLEGPAGCGKKTLARLLARAAVCGASDPAARPCGVCAACRKVTEGIHPDITLLTGSADTAVNRLYIDRIRELRADAQVLPNEADFRIFILADAQYMTIQAQNALLKILEEPPPRVRFMLTCENRAQLLETIRSRTAVVTLGAVPWETARPLLQKRLPQADAQALAHAFCAAGGIIGRVADCMEDAAQKKAAQLLPQLAAALTALGEWQLLSFSAQFEKDKPAFGAMLSELELLLRDALVLHYGCGATLSAAADAAAALSAHYSGARLMAMLREVKYLQTAQQHKMNHTLLLTQFCARLRRAAGS